MSAPSDVKGRTFTHVVDGRELTATVSPASWMYAGYGLQLRVTLPDAGGGALGGDAYLHDKSVDGSQPTEEQVMGLFRRVALCKCSQPGCERVAFDPAKMSTNRGGQCEECFMTKLRAQFDAAAAKEAKKEAALDAKMKAKGFTHKVVAWVHPKAGGDDYKLIIHSVGKLTDAAIKKELRKEGSNVETDYTIVEL